MKLIGTQEWYDEVEKHFHQSGGEWNFELLDEMAEQLDMEEEWEAADGDFEPLAWIMFEKLGFK